MTYLEELAKKEERDTRIVAWTREGLELPGDRGGDTDVWEDEVWWGYWRMVGAEDVHPPDAMFQTEDEALAFGRLVGEAHDWHVQPVVVRIEARDTFEVPR